MIDWKPIAEKFREADAILIGASNGLSITEGLHLFADNAVFERLFGDFKRKYGLECILQGMMAGWSREEEKWAFWARLIHHYCGQYQPTSVMNDLKAIVERKITLSSHQTEKVTLNCVASIRRKSMRLRATGLLCSVPALATTLFILVWKWPKNYRCRTGLPCAYRVGAALSQVRRSHGHPHGCGSENDSGYRCQARFQNFLKTYHGKKLVVLELGIGWRNQLIKAPMMRLVASEPNATYVTINLGEIYIADNIKEKSFGLDGRLDELLPALREACEA